MNPQVGDEVLYHADDRWIPAEVVVSRTPDILTLMYENGSAVSQHGSHVHGWLTYEEAARHHAERSSA